MGAGYLAALKALPEVAKAQAALALLEGGTAGLHVGHHVNLNQLTLSQPSCWC